VEALARLSMKPLGVWTTPWQADSLLGALACSWARSRGAAALRRDFLEPWLAGEPPFVLSDAFPGDSLPTPAAVPLWWDWPPDRRKEVKKHRWLTAADFRRVQLGEQPVLERVSVSVRSHVRLRNTISRVTDTTGGGELFEVPYSDLNDPDQGLSIYVRATRRGVDVLMQALELLGRTGYGADASVGHGGFELPEELLPSPALDDVPEADGFISLSTWQPARTDPVDGLWRVFVKYGKLAPEFHATAVFKRPQVMLEAGACFRTGGPPRPYYGGTIAPDRLLAPADRSSLAAFDVHPMQAAFSLAVPTRWRSAQRGRPG
jgi:CRISPR-associated protein Csm4